jgi:hypothetical protein
MGNWTISVAQLPIPGTGKFHNIILIRDDAGNLYKEIDGGPADDKGHLIGFGSNNMFQAGTAHTSGTYPVGAEIFDQAHYY